MTALEIARVELMHALHEEYVAACYPMRLAFARRRVAEAEALVAAEEAREAALVAQTLDDIEALLAAKVSP